MERKIMPHRVPLVKLPPGEWRIKDAGPIHFAVSVYGRVIEGQTTRHWQKWSILDFPNDLFGLEDLVSAGLDFRYVAAIEEEELGAARMEAHRAAQRAKRDHPDPLHHGVKSAVVAYGRKALDFLQSILPTRFSLRRS